MDARQDERTIVQNRGTASFNAQSATLSKISKKKGSRDASAADEWFFRTVLSVSKIQNFHPKIKFYLIATSREAMANLQEYKILKNRANESVTQLLKRDEIILLFSAVFN